MDNKTSPPLEIPPIGRNRLILSNPTFIEDGGSEYSACLDVEGLIATALIEDFLDNGLAAFFQDLAEHWQGWRGEKAWVSMDSGLQLSCSSDRLGQHQMTVTVEPAGALTRPWTVTAALCVEAGQLEQIANAVTAFFRPPKLNSKPSDV